MSACPLLIEKTGPARPGHTYTLTHRAVVPRLGSLSKITGRGEAATTASSFVMICVMCVCCCCCCPCPSPSDVYIYCSTRCRACGGGGGCESKQGFYCTNRTVQQEHKGGAQPTGRVKWRLCNFQARFLSTIVLISVLKDIRPMRRGGRRCAVDL